MTKDQFREQLGIALGEASVAWSELPGGVFDSTKCAAIVDRLCAAMDSHFAVLEEARTALQFYADKANHRQVWAQVSDCPSCSYRTSPVIEDEGGRARTFLAKLEERER